MVYRPPLASERIIVPPGIPYRGCGISTIWHGYAVATHGETTLNNKVRVKTTLERAKDLKRGWRAFEATGDDNGYPDQGDVDDICNAMFPDLPLPILFNRRDWSAYREKIKTYAISIAVRLRALHPSSPLRRYTSADHQLLCLDERRKNGQTEWLIYDPMKPQTNKYWGIWVPMSHVKKGALAIENGLVISSLFPRGKWTQEALTRRQLRAVRAERDEAEDTLDDCRDKLRKCREHGDPGDARAEGWDAYGAAIISEAERLRTEGEI